MAKGINKQIGETFQALLNLYITEHGGIENNAYIGMCWMSGRFEDLTREFEKRQTEFKERERKTK